MQERTGLEIMLLQEQNTNSNYNSLIVPCRNDQDKGSRAKNDNAKT